MTRTISTLAAAALASTAMLTSTAGAQGYGHGHGHGYAPKHHVCVEEVKTEAVYGTVRKAVVKQPERWEVKEHAAVYGERNVQVLVKAGWWETKVEPAVYEDRERQVLVSPEHVIPRFKPAVIKYERVEHKVKDHYGHEKVVYSTKPVIVEEAKKWVEKIPAVYKTVKFKVLVKAEKIDKIYHQPVYETKAEKVLVKPAFQERIYHKPIIDYVDERVVVKPAGVFKRVVHKAHGEKC